MSNLENGESSTEKLDFESVPRRILMTADTVGGVWTYALELARALEKENIEVALATMGAPLSPKQAAEAQKISNIEIFESNFKLEWMDDAWGDVEAAGEWLLNLERHLQPDVVHLNGYAHGSLHWNAPTIVVGHSCVLSWWRAVKGENAPANWNLYREKIIRGLHSADCVIAPTRAMLAALEENYGVLANKRVVPNGRDASFFAPAAKENFVLTAGRLWDEAKNVAALCRIAPRLDWKIYIAGEEKHPANGSEVETNFENVQPLGKLSSEEIADWFARAAIYALPARYEPFGLSALEAALSGCALVLGDIPSLRETWQDAAVFVSPDDEDALKEAIEELMNDEHARKEFAKRARARALQFTPERMKQGYLEIYAELVKKRDKTSAKEKQACAL